MTEKQHAMVQLIYKNGGLYHLSFLPFCGCLTDTVALMQVVVSLLTIPLVVHLNMLPAHILMGQVKGPMK